MGLQLKRALCSKIFPTGPSELGNVVCQMENQTKSRKTQGDYILQVCTRQKNRTQPTTVWRDSKSISSSEVSRNYFRLPNHFQKALRGHPGSMHYQVPPFKAPSQQKWGPSPSTLIQIHKQRVRPIFEYGSLSTITTSDHSISKIQWLQNKFIRLILRSPKYICSKLLHDSSGLPCVKDRLLSCSSKSLIELHKIL